MDFGFVFGIQLKCVLFFGDYLVGDQFVDVDVLLVQFMCYVVDEVVYGCFGYCVQWVVVVFFYLVGGVQVDD